MWKERGKVYDQKDDVLSDEGKIAVHCDTFRRKKSKTRTQFEGWKNRCGGGKSYLNVVWLWRYSFTYKKHKHSSHRKSRNIKKYISNFSPFVWAVIEIQTFIKCVNIALWNYYGNSLLLLHIACTLIWEWDGVKVLQWQTLVYRSLGKKENIFMIFEWT